MFHFSSAWLCSAVFLMKNWRRRCKHPWVLKNRWNIFGQAYQGERELESQHRNQASESMLGNCMLIGRMKVLRTKIQIYYPHGYGLKNTSWTLIIAGNVALYECRTILRDVTPHQSCLCSQWGSETIGPNSAGNTGPTGALWTHPFWLSVFYLFDKMRKCYWLLPWKFMLDPNSLLPM